MPAKLKNKKKHTMHIHALQNSRNSGCGHEFIEFPCRHNIIIALFEPLEHLLFKLPSGWLGR
jgi:hypothetical protein